MRAAAILVSALCASCSYPGSVREGAGTPNRLRVCADPSAPPLSDRNETGLENRLASLIARDLALPLEYTYWPQRRDFLRNTIRAKRCDVVMGVPEGFDALLTTRPYYRSSYVFVQPASLDPPLRSFDDPRLGSLRIGVQLVGDDGFDTPPVHALVRRGLADRLIGFPVQRDRLEKGTRSTIVTALDRGELDAAVVWGPAAAFYARTVTRPLRLEPVATAPGDPPMRFAISVGVARSAKTLHARIDEALLRRQPQIAELLGDPAATQTEPIR
ncbi:MAG: quinoprotein dehydrogenase-associated putative ABC transporter substrate-binding protein [Myxococcota bacterium]|jgi:mxaJ protein|nr:quinoprotein dehydrogenase-associated putative ABC transporter substrate-binding protein [Myxococcota bacterium]